MKALKLLIAEDETLVAEELLEILNDANYEVIGRAATADEALRLAASRAPNIALLDINLNTGEDGIKLARKLQDRYDTKIIFLTAYDQDEIIQRAAAIHPFAYLTKPFTAKGILTTVKMAAQQLNGNHAEHSKITEFLKDRLFVKTDDQFTKVMLEDIAYIEAFGSYCRLHVQRKTYTLAINLKTFLAKIDNPIFVRVHRSFIVNLKMVDSFNASAIYVGKMEIPLSSSYKSDFLKSLNHL